jgi:hypothetical protein
VARQANHSSSSKNCSPNINFVPSGRSAESTETKTPSVSSWNVVNSPSTPKENLASASDSLHSLFCPSFNNLTIQTLESLGEVRQTLAGEPDGVVFRETKCNCASILRHASSIQNATLEEISFMHYASFMGLSEAKNLASKLHWQCQRPLRVLRAMTNERARNYSARSAKRKPLSGSSASSRKRS